MQSSRADSLIPGKADFAADDFLAARLESSAEQGRDAIGVVERQPAGARGKHRDLFVGRKRGEDLARDESMSGSALSAGMPRA